MTGMQASALSLSHLESLLFIFGLSGAGKSTAFIAVEDERYYTLDNLPSELLAPFIDESKKFPKRFARSAVMLNTETDEHVRTLSTVISQARKNKEPLTTIYLDCRTDIVRRRYSETRRPHPKFYPAIDNTLEEAIERERGLLTPLRSLSDFVLDTSLMKSHQLKKEICDILSKLPSNQRGRLRLNFISFGFKYGAPVDCDLIFDVRFLTNPYFENELRSLTGKDPEVIEYLTRQSKTTEFLEQTISYLSFLLPQYVEEGKAYLNVGIGCTGGKHRSVAVAEALGESMQIDNILSSVRHRDLGNE